MLPDLEGNCFIMQTYDDKTINLSFEQNGSGKKKKALKKWLWLIGLAAAAFLTSLGIRQYNIHRFHFEKQTRFMMDTYVSIYAVGPEAITEPAVESALDRMQAIDVKFNPRNPDSPIYEFNERGIPISDPEIVSVARMALQIAEESDGAFDITVAPLIELWGFYGESPRVPTDEEIKRCLETVGFRLLSLSETTLAKKKTSVKIDLGGIAKGYAVAQAAMVLKHGGVTSAMIDAGGDIYAIGKKGGAPWKVGVKRTRGDGILGYIEVEDLSVMGSGDYERFFLKDGKRYHHIFNPKTGYPVQGLFGSTLVHPDPIMADAWNTAVFILGADQGMRSVESHPGMETIMVTDSGKILYSTGLKDALSIIQK